MKDNKVANIAGAYQFDMLLLHLYGFYHMIY